MPDESYPLYSRDLRPSIIAPEILFSLTAPIIPHMLWPQSFGFAWVYSIITNLTIILTLLPIVHII